MRWLKAKFRLENALGERKCLSKFLWFPRWLRNRQGKAEWRWLERSLVTYEVCKVDVGGSGEWGNYAYQWVPIEWAD